MIASLTEISNSKHRNANEKILNNQKIKLLLCYYTDVADLVSQNTPKPTTNFFYIAKVLEHFRTL